MNPNTVKFWDKQFKEEWKVINTLEWGTDVSKKQFYRWDGLKFGIVGNNIHFRGKMLDMACGLGHFCRHTKARNPFLEVWGTDFSPVAIKYAKELDRMIGMNNTYLVSDALNQPFEDNSFDTITAMEVIEHLSDPVAFIEEIKRLLKPNGRVYITTPWRDFEGMKSIEHIREWTPKGFAEFLDGHFERADFVFPPALTDVINKKTQMTYWFMVICQK